MVIKKVFKNSNKAKVAKNKLEKIKSTDLEETLPALEELLFSVELEFSKLSENGKYQIIVNGKDIF